MTKEGHEVDRWFSEVDLRLRAVVGDDIVDTIRERWEEHDRRELTEVTLFGPFDSGKSTLLKRLLHEGGVAPPSWLTISARRETWDTNEIDVLGLTLTDTPGIAAGDAEHERMATDTITLTDALVVVLPPQLLTSDKDLILSVITGRFFGPEEGWSFPPGALRVVLARMDEGTIDPGDNPAEYARFSSGKVDELRRLLAGGGAPSDVSISTVIADPYALVANATDPDIEYEPLNRLDGVADLVFGLQALAEDQSALREAAHVRYVLHAGRRIAGLVDRNVAGLQLRAEELQRRVDEQRAIRNEVESLVAAAHSDLVATVNDEAQAVAEEGAGPDDIKGRLAARVDARAAAWQEKWDLQLGELAARLGERYETDSARPMSHLLEDLFTDTEPESAIEQGIRRWDLLERSGPALDQALKAAIKSRVGMPLEEAQKELGRLEALKPEERAAELAGEGSRFTSEQALSSTKRLVGAGVVALELAPVVFELGKELHGLLQEQRLGEQEAERLGELRERVREVADEVAAGIFEGTDDARGWHAGPQGLLDAAERAEELLLGTLQGLVGEQTRQVTARQDLLATLDRAPRP